MDLTYTIIADMKHAFRSLAVAAATVLTACNQSPAGPERVAQAQTAAVPPTVSVQRRTPTVIAVHSVMPSIVNIQTESTIRRPSLDPWGEFFGGRGRTFQTQALGSGFVWSSDGLIVTNAHVVEGTSSVSVLLQDGTQYPAEIIGVDPDSDLAVLRVEARGLTPAQIGTSSDLLIGESVIAVGNPFGLSGTVTTGVVSATGRSVPSQERGRTFTDFIQTDASINPGNSGGPLLNIEGRVIGINVAIYAQAQGIGFAIPVDRAKKVIEDLRRFGQVHQAFIGAATSTLTPEEARRRGLAVSRGALVTRVFEGSPAARAGLRPGDVITAVGAAPVESRESFSTLTSTASSGSAINLTVIRERTTLNLTVVPTDPPENLGLRILEQVSGLGVATRGRAVEITSVARASRAADIGLQAGDLIVGVGGTKVSSTEQLDGLVIQSADRSSLVLNIARGRYIYTLSFPMGI